ncbi:CDP-diacylglycerol diphosphatase [Methylobacterium oryzisoli]|uniref:CDP-diacylglycerol diphosphatase n=1 Tax=Methylobacterium oryzisoli TaxID=3385502 RepID=UPI00389266BC
MQHERRRHVSILVSLIALCCLLIACALYSGSLGQLFGAGTKLWSIVHGQCVPRWLSEHKPDPCRKVTIDDDPRRGWVILKDRIGRAQHLLIPTSRISGIESPLLQAAGGPNYFAIAWRHREFLADSLGRRLTSHDVILTVNSQYRRSQGQLHVHMDCVQSSVRERIESIKSQIGEEWSLLPLRLAGHRFRARRILVQDTIEQDTIEPDPFRLLGILGDVPTSEMGHHSLAVLAADFGKDGSGFIILDGYVSDRLRGGANGGELQDHDCNLSR